MASIVLGSAFVVLGGIGWLRARMFEYAARESHRDWSIVLSGIAAAIAAGLAGAVLSISNLGFATEAAFGGVAVVVFGLGLLWHSGVMRHLGQFTGRSIAGAMPGGPFAVNALTLAPVRDFLVGLAGVVLGVLAIMGIAPIVLQFVALLAISGAIIPTATTACSATLATVEGAYVKK